jgi:hypothetical protein
MSDLGLHGNLPLDEFRRKTGAGKPNLVLRYFSRFEEGEVMRWAFRGLLIGAIAVLALDLRELSSSNGFLPTLSSLPGMSAPPVLPPVRDKSARNGDDPRRHVTTDQALLDRDMQFTLGSGGELALTGRIVQGSAEAFAEEVEARGEYVKTVVIDSPGGALEDAMAMARLIRKKGFATELRDGSLCASSCPLLFSGGVKRKAGPNAAIGLHQFYAAAGGPDDAAAALSSAQATTAKISRFLSEMGVDAALWLHALDTPPQALYYLSAQERSQYRLVTGSGTLAAAKKS